MVWRSRYIPGGDIQNSSTNKTQYNLSRIFNILIKRILDLPILDTTNGFFAFKRKLLSCRDIESCFQGYGDFSFLFLFKLGNEKLVAQRDLEEIPSVYKQRIAGVSKTKLFKVGLSYSFVVLKTKFFYYFNVR